MSTNKEELIGIRGSSLVEVLIALTIFSLTISASVMVFFGGQGFVAESLTTRKGMEKAHDGAEALRAIRDKQWSTLTTGTHGFAFLSSGSWIVTDTPDLSDGYTRKASISVDVDGIKHVDITVSWQQPPQGTKSLTLHETLAPPDQGLYGDWTNPCILSTADGGSGSKGTDVFYANARAYVTSSAVAANKEDLFIFNVASSRSPSLLGSLNVEQGAKAVTVSGNYAYIIEENSPDFFVIDVSAPSTPVQKAKITLTGGSSGRYVMARGNYVYATTASSSAGPEFFVIDVTDPLAPAVVATQEFGFDINEVSVLQNTAYLATSSDTKELIAMDITNPLAPTELGSYDAPGTADGSAVHAKSKIRVYFTRNVSDEDELYVLDTSNPVAITSRGSTDVSEKVHTIIATGILAFIGTADTNEEFQAYYVRDPLNVTEYGDLNFSNIGTGADYYNNIVYMSVQNNDLLQLVTSTINGVCGG